MSHHGVHMATYQLFTRLRLIAWVREGAVGKPVTWNADCLLFACLADGGQCEVWSSLSISVVVVRTSRAYAFSTMVQYEHHSTGRPGAYRLRAPGRLRMQTSVDSRLADSLELAGAM